MSGVLEIKNSNFEDLFSILFRNYSESVGPRFLILVGGCSRTGKSTLAKKIESAFRKIGISTITVELDNWLLGIDERTGNETVRERYNYLAIVEAIMKLLNGEKIFPPIYNPKTRRVNRNNVSSDLQISKGVCIVEGVIALDIPSLRDLSDFNIYTELNDKIRKKRLLEFYHQHKKFPIDKCNDIISARELEEIPIIKETMIFADIVYYTE
ncbi:MAG: uridine kinase [Candidatus Odinarchaeota archaeon]